MKKRLTAILFLFFLWPCLSWGADVCLKWNPNTEKDLAGYKVFFKAYGVPAYDYTRPVWTGAETTCTVSVDSDGEFVARAFDEAGNQSKDSNEVVYTMPDVIPPGIVEGLELVKKAIDNLTGAYDKLSDAVEREQP